MGGDDAGTVLPASVAATADVTVSYNDYTSAQPGSGQVSQITDSAGSESYFYNDPCSSLLWYKG